MCVRLNHQTDYEDMAYELEMSAPLIAAAEACLFSLASRRLARILSLLRAYSLFL